MTREQQIEELASRLIDPCRGRYEQLREDLIDEHGYDEFRAMLREAFALVLRPRWRAEPQPR